MRVGIVVLFIWLVLLWLSALTIGRELKRIAVALETQVITLVLLLRQAYDTDSLMETLDDLEEETKDANRKNSG